MNMTVSQLKDAVEASWGSPEHAERRRKWQRFVKEFSGKWWNEQELSPQDSKVFCNFIFSTIQTTAPLLTDNRPLWSILPRKYFFQRLADVYNDALKFVWEVTRMDEKLLDAVYDSLIGGTAIFKVYFDPDLSNGLGDIAVDIVDPFDFVIAPGYDDAWNASWCGMRKLYPVEEVKRMFPDKAHLITDQDVVSHISNKEDRRNENELIGDYVMLYEIWLRDPEVEEAIVKQYNGMLDSRGLPAMEEKKVSRAKYPNGRIITFLSETCNVLSDKPSPFNHGKPPYVALYDYRIPHEFWGQGEPDQIESLNREFNVRLQQIVEHARKYTKRNAVLDGGSGITDQQLKNAIAEGDQVLVSAEGFAKDVVHFLDVPALPDIVTSLMNIIPKLIEEVSGVTDVSKGVTGKKQRQTATEMSMLLESSYTRVRQRVRNLEATIKKIATLMVEIMMQYYTEPRDFYVKRDEEIDYGVISNSADFVKGMLKPAEKPGLMESDLSEEEKQDLEDYEKLIDAIGDNEEVLFDFNVEVITNSTLPIDRQSLANMMLRLAEMKIVDAQAVLETLRIPGMSRILARLEEQKKQEQAAAAGGGQQPQTPQGQDNMAKIQEQLQDLESMNAQGEVA